MDAFYKDFQRNTCNKYDGMIITARPLGQVPFEDVYFWQEMTEIMDWTLTNVTSVMYLCWGVQAAMYHLSWHSTKVVLPKKLSGVYPHHLVKPSFAHRSVASTTPLTLPHSRYAEVPVSAIQRVPELEIIAASEIAGAYIIASSDGRQLFVTGHSEYEPLCLKDEYERDLAAGQAPGHT